MKTAQRKKRYLLIVVLIIILLLIAVVLGNRSYVGYLPDRSSVLSRTAAQFSVPPGCSVFSSRAFSVGEQAPAFPTAGYALQYGCQYGLAGPLQDNIDEQLRALHYAQIPDTQANPDQLLQARYQNSSTVLDYQIGTRELANRAKLGATVLSENQKRSEHATGINIIIRLK